jgi:LysR family glycine cleavage system transcriptional activator
MLATARSSGEVASLLPRHLIHIMGHENHWLKVRQVLQVAEIAARAGPTVDTTIAALELAASGAGCALAHRIFLSAYLATGRLVVALDHEFPDDNSYFVVAPERPQRIRREVQLFRDWLLAAAAAENA